MVTIITSVNNRVGSQLCQQHGCININIVMCPNVCW